MTNEVFAMPKVKVQRQVSWLETTRVVQVSEKASTFFYYDHEWFERGNHHRRWISRWRYWRTISVSFHQNHISFYWQKFDCFLSSALARLKTDRFPKNLLTNLRGFTSFQQCCKDRTEWKRRANQNPFLAGNKSRKGFGFASWAIDPFRATGLIVK